MGYVVDWNCHLLPGMGEGVTLSEAVSAISHLNDKYEMNHFCMMPDYDCTKEPISVFLLNRYFANQELRKNISKTIKIKLAGRALLTPDLHKTDGLESLLFSSYGYFPIRLPISSYDDWIDYEINRLLYKRHFKLLITSFELCLILYPPEIIKKLLRIPNAAFQLSYKSLTEKGAQKAVSMMLHNNSKILLGTGINSLDKAYQYDLLYYDELAKNKMATADYQTLLRQNHLFWKKYD